MLFGSDCKNNMLWDVTGIKRGDTVGLGSDEYWYVVSDESAELKTLEEYGLRFDIEENFLDDKSNGFQ